jgi:hypothetical protein
MANLRICRPTHEQIDAAAERCRSDQNIERNCTPSHVSTVLTERLAGIGPEV